MGAATGCGPATAASCLGRSTPGDVGSPGESPRAKLADLMRAGPDVRKVPDVADGPFYYVRDAGSRAAHHWDYERDRSDHSLCGKPYVDPIAYEGEERPRAVCRACQGLAGTHETRWWKERAQALLEEVASLKDATSSLRAELQRVRTHAENQRRQLAQLQKSSGSAKPANAPRAKAKAKKTNPKTPKSAAPTYRQPRIRIVSGGAPGLGERR